MSSRAAGYETLQKALLQLTGIDLAAYKENQMLRRLNSYLGRVGARDFHELARLIESDPDSLEQLQNYITINVSEFFRDPGQFERLARDVIPDLLAQHRIVNVWSAACSIGAEPYSLAILFHEAGAQDRFRLLATDIDRGALEEARAGVYTEDKMKNVSLQRRQRFFNAAGNGSWQIKPELRKNITFQLHNLLVDPYPADQHLILCRNVIIYFTEEAKDGVFRRLSAALAPGGYLLLGSTESLFGADRFQLEGVAPFLYRKKA